MKRMNLKSLTMILVVSLLFANCNKDQEKVSPIEAKLLEFKIINAGIDKNQSITGTIDEAKKTVVVSVPFETALETLTFEAKASNGAELNPKSGTTQNFATSKNILVTAGSTVSTYKVTVTRSEPTSAALMYVSFIAASGTKYPASIDYKTNEVNVNVISGYSTMMKIDSIAVGPAGATFTTTAKDNFVNLAATTPVTIKVSKDKDVVYTIKIKKVAAGIDTTSIAIANFSANKNKVPAVISDANTRDVHMSKGIIYAVSRQNGEHIYYWEQAKLFAGNPEPSELSKDGMDLTAPALFKISSVYTIGEKIYVSNMVNAKDNQLKVWYYANKDAKPQLILSYKLEASQIRLGDCFTIVADEQGNGKMFFSNFPTSTVKNQIYIFDISTFKTVNTTPKIISVKSTNYTDFDLKGIGQYGRVTEIPGVKDKYLLKGVDMGIAVIDINGNIEYMVPTDAVAPRAQDARIVTYNNARYLYYTLHAEGASGSYGAIVDISEGTDAITALKQITKETIINKTVNSIYLNNNVGTGTIPACTSAELIDDNLYVMNFATTYGFVVQKFSKAK